MLFIDLVTYLEEWDERGPNVAVVSDRSIGDLVVSIGVVVCDEELVEGGADIWRVL